jgi:hypothetical protein
MDLFEEVQANLNESLKSQEAVATPVATEPVVTPTPEPVATPTETQPVVTEQVKTEAPATQKEPVGLEIFKELGYETPDELKSSLNELKAAKEEYEKKLPYYQEVEKEFQNLVDLADPAKFFKTEEEYNNFLISQKLGEGKDFGVTQRIVRNDLSKLSDLDVLSLQYQYDTPRLAGQDTEIKRMILKKLGVDLEEEGFDINNPKLDTGQDIELARMAQQTRDHFNQAKASVQKPDRPDFRKKIEEQTQAKAAAEAKRKEDFDKMAHAWEGEVKGITETISKIEHKIKNENNEDVVDFVFKVDEEFGKNVPSLVMNYALSNNLPPTQENVKYAGELAQMAYVYDNLWKIAEAYKNQENAKLREQLDKERYNGTDFNTKTPPPGRDEDLAKKIESGVLKITGLTI